MKNNKAYSAMRKIISITILLLVCVPRLIRAQLLDLPLKKHKLEIVQFIKNNGGVIDTLQELNTVTDLLYSRKLKQFTRDKVAFYEMGLTVSHGYKYLAILNNEKLTMLKTRDFSYDFKIIIAVLKNIKAIQKLDEVALFLSDVKDIYDYNSNPPWDDMFKTEDKK
jgi:hypothetical protein